MEEVSSSQATVSALAAAARTHLFGFSQHRLRAALGLEARVRQETYSILP